MITTRPSIDCSENEFNAYLFDRWCDSVAFWEDSVAFWQAAGDLDAWAAAKESLAFAESGRQQAFLKVEFAYFDQADPC